MIDTHAHLTDCRYQENGQGGGQAVFSRAAFAGVGTVICVGYDMPSSVASCELAQKTEGIFYAAGVHPSDCETLDNGAIAALIELFKGEKCVGVGEIGIDLHYGKDNIKEQRLAFEKQIVLASEANLPFIVHSREATKEVTDTLLACRNLINNGFLMHCYSESKEAAKTYLDLGAYFAFGGVITFKNSKKDDIVRYIPKDRLLFETDCPYMSPEPHRGKINEPSHVKLVYRKAAEILGVDFYKLEEQVALNATTLFKKLKIKSN